MPSINAIYYHTTHITGLFRRLRNRILDGHFYDRYTATQGGTLVGPAPFITRLNRLVSHRRDRYGYISNYNNRKIHTQLHRLVGGVVVGRLSPDAPKVWDEAIGHSRTYVLQKSLTKIHQRVMEGKMRKPDGERVYAALRALEPRKPLAVDGGSGCLFFEEQGHYVRSGDGECVFVTYEGEQPQLEYFVEEGGATNVIAIPRRTGISALDLETGSRVCHQGLRSYFEAHREYSWHAWRGRYESIDYEHPYYEDDGESDEDRENDDGLLEYHSGGPERRKAVRYHEPMDGDALKGDRLTLGFEAEIEIPGRHQAIHEIKSDPVLSSVSILEEDGSLSDRNGFEMVTGWSSLHTVCDWGRRFCEVTSKYDYNVDDAGLHIAAGGLTELHVARIYGFVFDEFNRPLLRDLAGRDYNSYAGRFRFKEYQKYGSYWREKDSQPHAPLRARKVAAHAAKLVNAGASDRYVALNYRGDSNDYAGTLEFRLFKGTGNATRMRARLQFVWALCKYTDPLLCNPLTVEGFLRALASDVCLRRHTQTLREYIVRTQEHKTRYPAFSNEMTKIKTKENKKLLFEQSKKAKLALPA